jgi:NTE family protein
VEGDIPEETINIRGDIHAMLARLSFFSGLNPEIIDAIAAELEWLSLPGGATLFSAGEASDAMYLVLSGGLAIVAAENGRDRRRFLSRVGAGETVGEMGLISGRPRTANAVALRDTELGRLPRETFDRVFKRYPEAMLRMLQLLVSRLEGSGAAPRRHHQGPRTFTIVPQSLDVDTAGFAIELINSLRLIGRAELVWSVRGADHTSHWFYQIEAANDFVVYVADHTATAWSKLCVRQADSLLLLARAERAAGTFTAITDTRNAHAAPQRSELILLHDERILPGAAARWCALHPGVPHHHVRNDQDIARVARLLTGRAIGVVMSGGGARGFAHIGVVQAMRETGVPIDLVGGTSIGAIMGAAVAAEWTIEEMQTRFRRTFVRSNPLGDYTLPVIALATGRRVSQRLRDEFGDVDIADLPLPFYCVSANLTTGHHSVHRTGPLWKWTRASAAIPGVLPPITENGEVFVDGGTMNNLPVDVMREMGRGPVIGIDVGADTRFRANTDDVDIPPPWHVGSWARIWRRRPNIIQVLVRSGMVNSAAATMARREQTDMLLVPELSQVDMLNWKAFDTAVDSGYRHACARFSELTPELAARLQLRAVTESVGQAAPA